MRIDPARMGVLHFVGIGGIGMSGIAEVLHNLGYTVQGSDQSDNANVQRLRDKGMTVFTEHAASNIEGAELIVVSSAINAQNPELLAAREIKLPVVRRADMLGELMRLKKGIAIGGTHGKTTTTSMVACVLEGGNMDPTVINGGIVNAYGTNTRQGQSEWMVVEADESDGSFTRLPATACVITNIDPEHMESYGSIENLRKAFMAFVNNLPFFGFAVLCSDHPEVQALIPQLTDRRVVTYGFNGQADVQGMNLRAHDNGILMDVVLKASAPKFSDEETITDFHLPMWGEHNALNALAAIAVGRDLGIDPHDIKTALEGFSGVKRRFTKAGEYNGTTIIDDYGHHPVEIAAVLKAARAALKEKDAKVFAVMQPHRYSRLDDLMDEFSGCFHDADMVVIADVYAAGEQPIEGADKTSLVEAIKQRGHRDVHALSDRNALAKLLAPHIHPGDYVICLGAGDITHWAYALEDELYAVNGQARAANNP